MNYFESEIQARGIDLGIVSMQPITEATGAQEDAQGNL